jgi:hypothetical protein
MIADGNHARVDGFFRRKLVWPAPALTSRPFEHIL